MAITANSVREGIIAMLATKLPGHNVLGDPPSSEAPPYLLVELSSMSQTAMLGSMCSRTFGFDIRYTDSDGGAAELHGVAEELYEALEHAEVGGQIYRTANRRHEVLEGQLKFSFEMVIRLRRSMQEETKMGVLEQEAGVK